MTALPQERKGSLGRSACRRQVPALQIMPEACRRARGQLVAAKGLCEENRHPATPRTLKVDSI